MRSLGLPCSGVYCTPIAETMNRCTRVPLVFRDMIALSCVCRAIHSDTYESGLRMFVEHHVCDDVIHLVDEVLPYVDLSFMDDREVTRLYKLTAPPPPLYALIPRPDVKAQRKHLANFLAEFLVVTRDGTGGSANASARVDRGQAAPHHVLIAYAYLQLSRDARDFVSLDSVRKQYSMDPVKQQQHRESIAWVRRPPGVICYKHDDVKAVALQLYGGSANLRRQVAMADEVRDRRHQRASLKSEREGMLSRVCDTIVKEHVVDVMVRLCNKYQKEDDRGMDQRLAWRCLYELRTYTISFRKSMDFYALIVDEPAEVASHRPYIDRLDIILRRASLNDDEYAKQSQQVRDILFHEWVPVMDIALDDWERNRPRCLRDRAMSILWPRGRGPYSLLNQHVRAV